MNAILATGGMSWLSVIVIYAVVLGGFWFLLMRPQKKEQRMTP